MRELTRLIEELTEEGLVLSRRPAPNDKLTEAMEMFEDSSMPAELVTFYRRSNGGQRKGEIHLFNIDDFMDVNEEVWDDLPSAVFFASDGGEGWYFVDSTGALGRGVGAVFWGDRSVREPRSCIPVGDDLADFLRRAVVEPQPWKSGKNLQQLDIEEMDVALARAGERIRGFGPPATQDDFLDAQHRLGFWIDKGLRALLSANNGMEIQLSRVRVRGTRALDRVPRGSDNPALGAVWFADDSEGNRYAVTVGGWRDPDGGKVIRVAPGQSPAEAPIIGTLPAVVRGWLGEGKGH